MCTTGGHLVELALLAPLLEPERHRDALWVTHRLPQSESMLADRDVHYVPPVHARRVDQALVRTPGLLRTLRKAGVDVVYSTGAAVALAALPGARTVGARAVFIESLARPQAPSMAGRVLARFPWVECYTQYAENADRRWRYEYDLFRLFDAVPGEQRGPIERVLVTLGTARPWGFRRLVERLLRILPDGTEVIWQTGVTDVTDLPIDAIPQMSDDDLQATIRDVDVVVAHSGAGTVLRCLENGKAPVLVPRRAAHHEHVDDHQVQIAQIAADRGLAVYAEADEVGLSHLTAAAATAVRAAAEPSHGR